MEVKHKTHTITYREDTNDWFSPEIGIKPSLVIAKNAIDELERKGRRADVKALYLTRGSYYSRDDKVVEVKVGALAEPRDTEIREAWISYPEGKGIGREKVSLSSLYPLTMRAQLEEYIRLKQAAKAAESVAGKFIGSLDGYTAETIKAAKNEEASDKEAKK